MNPPQFLTNKYRERGFDMNNWNRLLKCLDAVYGFENQVKSSFKKIKQGFDDKSNEHVIYIEYRVMRGDMSVKSRKKAKDDGEVRRAAQARIGNLIRDINNQSKRQVLTGEPSTDASIDSPPIPTIP